MAMLMRLFGICLPQFNLGSCCYDMAGCHPRCGLLVLWAHPVWNLVHVRSESVLDPFEWGGCVEV